MSDYVEQKRISSGIWWFLFQADICNRGREMGDSYLTYEMLISL